MKVHRLLVLMSVFLLAADAPKEAETPELNKKVMTFAKEHLGEKVGDGECATLAVQALRQAGARGLVFADDGAYVWGKLVRTVTPGANLTGEALPGDILQFRDAVLAGRVGGSTFEASYPHHTSVVEAVKADGKVVEVLHQNFGDFRAKEEDRRKVQRTTLSFEDLKKGSVKVYRPAPRDGDKK
jgi:hypothetical protein